MTWDGRDSLRKSRGRDRIMAAPEQKLILQGKPGVRACAFRCLLGKIMA